MEKIIDVWVPGRPRTKGSLGGGRSGAGAVALADSPQSKAWRAQVANVVGREISDPVMLDGEPVVKRGRAVRRVRAGWPREGVPVVVSCQFHYVRVGETEMPIGRQWGDLDKLLRNVFDALQDAKVYKDDAQVVGIRDTFKIYGLEEGVRIQVWA